MLRTIRLAVLSAAIIGLMATMTPPASATTYKAITLTGRLVLSNGLGYPCTPLGTLDCTTATTTVKTGPKNEPQVNLNPGGNTAGFWFSSVACVKTSVSTPNKPTFKTGPADLCVLTATGVITGWCGLSTGAGVATLVNLTSGKETLTTSFKFTDVGGIFHVSGGNKDTNFYGEWNFVADINAPGGPSCTTKTATGFTMTGEAVYKDCTKGTTVSVCNP